MAFKSYEEAVGPIVLTYRGREYTLPTLTAEESRSLHESAGAAVPIRDLASVLLGDAREAMDRDRVPLSVVDRVLWTAVADWRLGRDAAEAVWNDGVPAEWLRIIKDGITTQEAAQ